MSHQSAHLPLNHSTPTAQWAATKSDVSPLQSLLVELRQRQRRPGSALGATIGSALEALWSNRMHSFLTTLGIFIGIASVVGAIIITQGATLYLNNQIFNRGTTIFVNGGATSQSGVSQGSGSLSSLKQSDALALQRLPHVSGVSSIVSSSEQAVYGDHFWQTTVEGVSADYATIQNLQLAQGSWFSVGDTTGGMAVAVLGKTVAQSLFGATGNPLNQQVRIRDHLYRVVGVLTGQNTNQNNASYIPLKTAQVRLKNTLFVDQIFVRADTISNVKQVQQAITSTLRQTHHLEKQSANDFIVQINTQFLQNAGLGNQVLLYLLVGIAAISLTVGGLGIMNIMLVSVTRRTWEIGIRIAIGARRRDIRSQFLIEALLLCLVGGAIGLLLGLLLGWISTLALQTPFVVTPVTLLVPFVVSVAIAMIFGIYPAVRASHLDPIVALRIDE